MTGFDEGDDPFDDGAFDDLPVDQLDEIESQAIRFTQFTQAQPLNPASSDYGDDFDDEDVDVEVVDTAKNPPQFPAQTAQFRPPVQPSYGTPAYQTAIADRSVPSQSRPSNVQSMRPPPSVVRPATIPNQQRNPAVDLANDTSAEAIRLQNEQLLQRIQALEQQVNAKDGEISIVRKKEEKARKEHERELAAYRKLHEDNFAKQQREIEASKEAERKAATELKFTKRDLAEEAERARSLRKANGKANGEPVTPKKNKKAAPHRDGFDDDDLQMISPSKLNARRSNHGTPTKPGAKRKRKGQDSPMGASLDVRVEDDPKLAAGFTIDESLLEKLGQSDERFDFLQMMLDHRNAHGKPLTFEQFTTYAFPSSPGASFSAVLLGKLPLLGSKKPASNFPVEFCQLLISMWEQCIKEKYYKPVHLLIDLLTFALELKTFSIAPHIISTLLPIAQDTGNLIGVPRFSHDPIPKAIEENISISPCLSIIHLCAIGCLRSLPSLTSFWKQTQLNFVLMTLSPQMQIRDFQLMLHILSTSVMKDSVGPIVGDRKKQVEFAGHIISRVTPGLAWQFPSSKDEEEGDEEELREESSELQVLHWEILRALNGFCRSDVGGEALAVHKYAIGKIVRFLCDQMDALYDYRSGHEQTARNINLGIRLIHYVVVTYDKHINMQRQLTSVHGGVQKYLTCLSRLTFSDVKDVESVLDDGIDAEVVACARELLEMWVSPEEGESINAAFNDMRLEEDEDETMT